MSARMMNDKLSAVQAELSDLRQRRAEAAKARDRARDEFARVPGYDTGSPEFAKAQQAVNAVSEGDRQIEELQGTQGSMLRLVGQGSATVAADLGGDTRTIEKLKAAPGAWLASALDRRKAEVPQLREDIRTKAPETTDIAVVEESAALIDMLLPATVVPASGVNRLDIDTTSVRVPKL